MSLILEALKKSEKERENRAAGEAAPAPELEPESAPEPGPEVQTEPKPAPEPESETEPQAAQDQPRRSLLPWIAGAWAVLGAMGLANFITRWTEEIPRTGRGKIARDRLAREVGQELWG